MNIHSSAGRGEHLRKGRLPVETAIAETAWRFARPFLTPR